MHFRLRLRSRPELLGRGAPDHTTVFTVSLCDSLVSRDGRYISALTDGQTKAMLFDTKTKHWSTLMEGEQVPYNEWSRDGKYVFMRENLGGAAELVRVRIKDQVVEHILSLEDFPQLADIFAV